jgi:hypothetical protein
MTVIQNKYERAYSTMPSLKFAVVHNIKPGEWDQISKWCEQNAGRDNWYYNGSVFWFREKESMLMFKLRWS